MVIKQEMDLATHQKISKPTKDGLHQPRLQIQIERLRKKVREGVKTGNEGIGSRGPRVNISLPIFFLSSPQLSGERLDASDDWSWRSNYLAYHSYVCRMI
jgi:hypothetical protein